MLVDYQHQLERLLNAVNKVTAAHRHGLLIRDKDLDFLSNRQIEVEQAISPQPADAADHRKRCAACGELVDDCQCFLPDEAKEYR